MEKYYIRYFIILTFLLQTVAFAQEEEGFKHAIRATIAPQASFFSPYEDNFTEGNARYQGFSFGVEGSKWVSPNVQLSLGYYFSQQVGNTDDFFCLRIGPNPCPQRRAKINIMKIPFTAGIKIHEAKNYQTKFNLGPQIQINFTESRRGRPDYKPISLGIVGEWSHYFVLGKHLDFVGSLRYDQSITNVDENSLSNRYSAVGLHLGLNYNL
ncbi:MAG: outer membrane beta-barrel protein [Bacteroidia bacterium]|nr:outer membrane beta-barrel protein [Bacteroidia bacterium]